MKLNRLKHLREVMFEFRFHSMPGGFFEKPEYPKLRGRYPEHDNCNPETNKFPPSLSLWKNLCAEQILLLWLVDIYLFQCNRRRIMFQAKTTIILSVLLLALPSLLFAVPSGKTITWPGGGYGTVKFEGDEHSEKGYNCDACHPGLFQMKKGSAKLTMDSLNKGLFCGACHNGISAFSTSDPKECHECHKDKSKKKDRNKHKDDHD